MAYALEIQDIHKVFNRGTINEKVALNGVNLNLNPGDFVTIIGGNGAGKSTTLNAIAGVWPIDSGKIIIDGTDITSLPEHKRAKYLGRVFQDPMTGTAATMDIEENMAIALRRGEKRTLRWGVSREDRELFREKLQTLGLGLEDRMTSKVGLLSGGQRQAITLLMAALKQPKLLLLDEHTAALDPKTAAKVLEISDKIIAENQLTARRHSQDQPPWHDLLQYLQDINCRQDNIRQKKESCYPSPEPSKKTYHIRISAGHSQKHKNINDQQDHCRQNTCDSRHSLNPVFPRKTDQERSQKRQDHLAIKLSVRNPVILRKFHESFSSCS